LNSMLPDTVLYWGKDRRPREPLRLQAGPLSMWFDPDWAFLRAIRLSDLEVLRGIYFAVRDRHWGTVTPAVSNLNLETGKGGFTLTFDVDCRQEEIDFFWRGRLTGEASGTLVYAMDGVARTSFLRNRIGFCVLHSTEICAGKRCRVEHTDGSLARASSLHRSHPTSRSSTCARSLTRCFRG